uniref:CSON007382 protein n=1 Tax=Culicoides sonorensis TaxID=179676 RepID=A0A336LJP5_CULSO
MITLQNNLSLHSIKFGFPLLLLNRMSNEFNFKKAEYGENNFSEKNKFLPKSVKCKCNLPNCIPTVKLRYVQPMRPASFKPIRSYVRPEIKIDAETVYSSSFKNIDKCIAKTCKPPPILPVNHLKTNQDNISNDTITKLSYPGYYNCQKRVPILPRSISVSCQDPLTSITTHNHDYDFKTASKCKAILPKPNILKAYGPMEKETTQRLSYAYPISEGPPKSLKPVAHYRKPTVKMESDTVNKLSFLPFCINKREVPVWSIKPCFKKPSIDMDKDTTYKLSFLPNYEAQFRPKEISPVNNLSIDKCNPMQSHTIYKDSFFFNGLPHKTTPILPKPNLNLKFVGPVDSKTIYKVSFPMYYSYEKTKPIIPNSALLIEKGTMQSLTTNKHDFLLKPLTRIEPIKPKDSIELKKGAIDNNTTMKLSFQNERNYMMVKSFKPVLKYKKPEIPMESLTTQKLSYLPISILPKDYLPWAQKAKFEPPTIKFETATTQKLSYLPPGQIIEDHDCPCQLNQK